MSNNSKPELIIFKAILKDNKIWFERNSSHIPTLSYVLKQLDYDITELQALEKAQQEMAKQGIIQKATNMTLNQLLRRGHKR